MGLNPERVAIPIIFHNLQGYQAFEDDKVFLISYLSTRDWIKR
jgi:hypothetical protein